MFMVRSVQKRTIFTRFACCVFGLMIFFNAADTDNSANFNTDLYEQGDKGSEESQEEVAYKIQNASLSIKIENLITPAYRHGTKIFEYLYQNPYVDILIPPPK